MGTLVELLQGKLSKAMMELVTGREYGLFPKPKRSRCGAVARTAPPCASTSPQCCTASAIVSIRRRNCCSCFEAWIIWN